MGAHRDEALVRRHHEAAGRDALGIQLRGVHEVVNDERELPDLPAACPERLRVPGGEGEEPPQDQEDERGARERPGEDAGRRPERADPRVPDVRRLADDRGEELRIGVQVDEAVLREEDVGNRVAIRVADADVVPSERGAAAGLLDALAHARKRDRARLFGDHAAASRRLDLERGEAHDVGVLREEADESRDLGEVPVVDGRVENDMEAEAPHPLDVLLADRVEALFGGVALPLLREVDVDRDVREAGFLQLPGEVARQLDAVRHERGLETEAGRLADDRDELVALPERGVASRDLHAHAVTVLGANPLESLQDESDRDVLDLLGRLGEIAKRAVEVAPLRDLDGDASDRVPASDGLRRNAELRVELFESRRQLRMPAGQVVENRKSLHRASSSRSSGNSSGMFADILSVCD